MNYEKDDWLESDDYFKLIHKVAKSFEDDLLYAAIDLMDEYGDKYKDINMADVFEEIYPSLINRVRDFIWT